MGHGTTRCLPYYSSRGGLPWCLFYVAMLVSITGAQSIEQSSSFLRPSPESSAFTFSTAISSSRSSLSTAPPQSTVFPSNSTTSSSSPAPTNDRPELFPAATSDGSQRNRRDAVFNYYFLFLALFGIFTAVFLWWIHKRRKQRKEQMRLGGHDALARDMDGWINTRRWFHGARRHNQTAAFVRREEGLNEHGEAPPPYEPKNDDTVVQAGGRLADRASGLSIPLRTLSRDDIELTLPPGYRTSLSRDSNMNETRTMQSESGPTNYEPLPVPLRTNSVAQLRSPS